METVTLETGRFLSNITDPDSPRARMYFVSSYYAFMAGKDAIDMEWDQYMKWVNENMICPPKATDTYTQQELINIGMIGLYAKNKKAKLVSGKTVDYDLCEPEDVSVDSKHYTLIGKGRIYSLAGVKQLWFPQTTSIKNFYCWKD